MRTPEKFEERINANMALVDLDEEFRTTHETLLERFYSMFESIYRCVHVCVSLCEALGTGAGVLRTSVFVWKTAHGERPRCRRQVRH